MENITPKVPVEIGDIVERIVASFSPERIILLGSYASGNVTPDSDLDLLVIGNCQKEHHQRQTTHAAMERWSEEDDVVVEYLNASPESPHDESWG